MVSIATSVNVARKDEQKSTSRERWSRMGKSSAISKNSLDYIKRRRLSAVMRKDIPLTQDMFQADADMDQAKLLFLIGFTSVDDSTMLQAEYRSELRDFAFHFDAAPSLMREYAREFVKEHLNEPEQITFRIYRRWLFGRLLDNGSYDDHRRRCA